MNKHVLLMVSLIVLFFSVSANAKVVTQTVEYKHGEVALEGYMAYDDAVKGNRPGVIVVHEWWGLNSYIKRRAEQLAGLGYVAFAIDMYGKGVRPKDAKEAGALANIYMSDRKLMRGRAEAALDLFRKNPRVDEKWIAAIGYCFGGTVVLEMARGGVDLAGVVSFYGVLDTPNVADAKNIKGKILTLHGADDPFVTREQVTAFWDEMRKAGVDWQMVIYGGAVHSFTNPDSGNDPSKGVAYNEKADTRSWSAMSAFFEEIFEE